MTGGTASSPPPGLHPPSMTAYTYTMSNHDSHPAPQPSTDRPTATYPTSRPAAPTAYPLPEGWRIDPAGYLPQPSADGGTAAARLEEADATPTVVLPAKAATREAILPTPFPEVGPALAATPGTTADAAFTARAGARVGARVYHTAQTDRRSAPCTMGRRERLALQRGRRERRERVRRHLRAALTAIALAAALLSVLQAYAAQGISQARQAALAARTEGGAPAAAPASAPSSTMSGQTSAPTTMSDRTSATPMSGQTDTHSDWVTQDTGAPYVRTNPHASPLADLPRCTTSPTTPMPCLAHVSTNSDRAVVLEEDGSLTALVRR